MEKQAVSPPTLERGDYVMYQGVPGMVLTPAAPGSIVSLSTPNSQNTITTYNWNLQRLDPKTCGISELQLLLTHYPRVGSSGTDPEIFAFDANGAVVPSFTYLPSKDLAQQAAPIADPIFWDGFQGEMAPAPARCHEGVIHHIADCLRRMAAALPPGAHLQTADVVEIPLETLQQVAPHFVEFGCSPSYNAYGPGVYPPIYFSDPYEHRLRYSGCHLHYSWNDPTISQPSWFPHGTVVMMDKIAGVLLTAFGRGLEDPRRRVAYGRPGEYRLPGPGRLEYRTPGSYLLRNPRIFHFALDVGRLSFGMGLRADGREASYLGDEAHEIITACDADGACAYIKKHWEVFQSVMKKLYGEMFAEKALYTVMEGAERLGMTDGDLLRKWQVTSTVDKTFAAQLQGFAL